MARKSVTVDFLPESALRYLDHDAIVCIDVLLTTTLLVTAAAQGRSVYPVSTLAEGQDVARRLGSAILAGETPEGRPSPSLAFGNSPSALARHPDRERPLVLVASCGVELLHNAAACPFVYVACFRNLTATAEWVAGRHDRVAVLGAGSRGTLRCEDQMAAARLARELEARGHAASPHGTHDLVRRWAEADLSLLRLGSSAEQLHRQGQSEDVEFVIAHDDDLDIPCRLRGGMVAAAAADTAAPRRLRRVV